MKYYEAYEAHLRGEKVEMIYPDARWMEPNWESPIGYYVDKKFRLALKKLTVDTPWVHDESKWRAVDMSGDLFEFSLEPIHGEAVFGSTGMCRRIGTGYDPTDWQKSKQERPRKKRLMTPSELAGKWVKPSAGNWAMVVEYNDTCVFLHGYGYGRKVQELSDNGCKWADTPSSTVHDSFEVDA